MQIQKHNRNRLTIAINETRLKLNGEDNTRLTVFAQSVDKVIREKLEAPFITLRGAFHKSATGIWTLHIKSSTNKFNFKEDNMTSIKTVTIPEEEYLELKRDQAHLDRLHAAGVDNWEGYFGPGYDEEDE